MSTYIYLLLPVLGALWSLVLVATKPSPALHARRWLVMSMVCAVCLLMLLIHYYLPSVRESVMLDLAYDAVMLAFPPCLCMCVYRLTSLRGPKWEDQWVFIPGALLWLLIASLCVVMGADEARSALVEVVLRLRPATAEHGVAYRMYAFFGHSFFRSYVIIALMAVLGWGAYAIRSYGRRLDDYLTNSPTTRCDFLLLYFSFVLMVAGGLVFSACEYSQTFVSWVLPAFSLTEAISLILMGYFARRVVYSAEQLVALRSAHDAMAAAEEDVDPMRERMARIAEEHLYRNPDLTIFTLSRILSTNRTYLTQAFRQYYDCSFAEYINQLRVTEADALMVAKPELTLGEIATQVGYNSATSLYRNYVKFRHHSPKRSLSK